MCVPAFVALLSLCATGIQYLAAVIYGLSMMVTYTCSALYHGLHLNDRLLVLFRRMDKSAIYLFIAGTVSPVALLALNGWTGWFLFITIWALALAGVLLTSLIPFGNLESTLLYLSMGWVTLIFIRPLFHSLPASGFAWCVVGGVMYTIGAIIYAADWPTLYPDRFESHELWHVLSLMGTTAHFVMIAGYVI